MATTAVASTNQSSTAAARSQSFYQAAYGSSTALGSATALATTAETSTDVSTFAWIAGWLVFLAILAFVAQTDAGHNVIYYSLVLIIVVLVVTQYQAIVTTLAPVGMEIPS